MSRINDLTQQQTELLDQIYFLDQDDEQDAEELDRLYKSLEKTRGDISNMLEWLAKIKVEMKAITEGRGEVARKATKRLRSAENTEKRMGDFILSIMINNDINKVNGEMLDIRTQLSPGRLVYVNGFDVDSLPYECIKIIPEQHVPVAAEIARRIKEGWKFDGVELVKEFGLRIS
jgi:hypothetical protein